MSYLVIYIVDNCETCNRVVDSAKALSNNYPNVQLKIRNIKESKSKLSIVPAVFINNNLFCYGDFDNNKLIEVITKQSS
jgi:glutaredoxin